MSKAEAERLLGLIAKSFAFELLAREPEQFGLTRDLSIEERLGIALSMMSDPDIEALTRKTICACRTPERQWLEVTGMDEEQWHEFLTQIGGEVPQPGQIIQLSDHRG
ncbi:hypothetical protein [Sphingobium sp. CFD-2]|uniref:hypothetical protein n=1 Tax=Sphingobium sp. CFD-2 TaxID=2878542 RepID=UPI00214C8A93|nr:hypothetical protein [Sphingobium sp. CFD-2]